MLTESIIDVRYPDCDPMGIVHHGVYPIWYEIARMDYFAGVGYSYTDMNQEGINPPMVNFNLNYHSPVRYPGRVTVRTVCTLCQGKKLELRYGVYQKGNPAPVATATSFHIWTGPDMKSLNMSTKPEIYEKLRNAVESPAVLILAGGQSRRMGLDKATLDLEGQSLLNRAVEFWKKALPGAPIYVSAGSPEHFDRLPQGVTPIYDLQPQKGPMGGLQAAFRQIPQELLWVSAVDMPLLNQEALELLNKKRCHCEDACVFTRDGHAEPLFGLYRNTCLQEIEAMLSQGDNRMTALLSRLRTTLVPLKQADWVCNVNTPEDMEALKETLGKSAKKV